MRGLLRRHPKLVLLLFSTLVTLLFLTVIEGACRIAGYGGYRPTFVKGPELEGGQRLIFTDHGGPNSYFFTNRSNPGSLDPTAFMSPKPANTFRVFIVGESAAKGNPYVRPLSAGAHLESMLRDVWPDRNVEVINLGVTAVASFPVLGIMTEALEYEPDLIVAYLGNNEFFGAYGVASLHSAGRSPTMIRLLRAVRSLGVAQFMDSLRGSPPNTSQTLMETMLGQSFLATDDPLRAAAAHNLETFVGEMIDRCKAAHVPIVVCTPPANERDLAPLGAEDLSGLPSGQQAGQSASSTLIMQCRAKLDSDPEAALSAAEIAMMASPRNATIPYLRGQALRRLGRHAEAAESFHWALSLDTMPWRPPATSVDAIRRAVSDHGAILCDLEAAFRAASEDGTIGFELMDDHVHASLAGQELIARQIVATLVLASGRANVDPTRLGFIPSPADVLARAGANEYERYAASHAMRLLAGIPFFLQSNPGFKAHHEAICEAIERAAPDYAKLGMRRWLEVTTHAAAERPISGWVAEAALLSGAYAEASRLFRFAARAVTPYSNWEFEYVYKSLMATVRAGRPLDDSEREAAAGEIVRIRAALAAGPSESGGPELWAGLLHQIRGELPESIPYLETARSKVGPESRIAADESLVRALVVTGRPEAARAIIDEGLSGPNPGAYRAMAGLTPSPR
jgi:tetratricopeptide (TPR) repeat protein